MPYHSNSHVFKDINGKMVLTKVYPTMQIAVKDGRAVAQDGKLYWPNGEPIPNDKWPKWALLELKKCSDETLETHGFDVTALRAKPSKSKAKLEAN